MKYDAKICRLAQTLLSGDTEHRAVSCIPVKVNMRAIPMIVQMPPLNGVGGKVWIEQAGAFAAFAANAAV